MLELQVGVAKVGKYGAPESGDTLEMIERPHGGFSFVLADGQGSGRGAKTLSNLVTTRAISMLKDGARDGAVARAVHDYLYAYRHGQVSVTLNILSVDMASRTILLSRNNPCPWYMISDRGLTAHSEPSTPIGLYPMTKPVITQLELRPYTYIVLCTDGMMQAGKEHGTGMDLENYLGNFNVSQGQEAQEVADDLLNRAIELDHMRPHDDMSVIVLAAQPMADESPIRRLTLCFPVDLI